MKAAPVLILIALASAATSCGQKGPLVLPDAEHPRKKVKFPAAPKSGAPAQPAAPKPPDAPATAPGSNPTPDAAPQG